MNILVITKPSKHSEQNSVYAITRELTRLATVHVADLERNKFTDNIECAQVDETFTFPHTVWDTERLPLLHFDLVLLRIPPPIPVHLTQFLKGTLVINEPSAAQYYGDKTHLHEFSEWTPRTQVVHTVEEVERFGHCVLKPGNLHGGEGIIKYTGTLTNVTFPLVAQEIMDTTKGDKRIVIINKKIVFSVLRMPAEGDWLCNIAQGGYEVPCTVTQREQDMVHAIAEKLYSKGIIFFAIDTLEKDGIRYLSEVNTASIGGIDPASKLYNKNYNKIVAKEIIAYTSQRQYRSQN